MAAENGVGYISGTKCADMPNLHVRNVLETAKRPVSDFIYQGQASL